jgi:hypothetical protein
MLFVLRWEVEVQPIEVEISAMHSWRGGQMNELFNPGETRDLNRERGERGSDTHTS